MNFHRLLLAILLLCCASLRAFAEAPVLPPPLDVGDKGWTELFATLESRTPIQSVFSEARWFPFRKKPVVLSGEMRFSKDFGLSLHYLQPSERTVIADAKGLLFREPGKKDVPLAADARVPELGNALMRIFRFDLEAIRKAFAAYGSREGNAWHLVFVPLDPKLARNLGRIEIEGAGEIVQTVQIRQSANQHIDITILETKVGVVFSAGELAKFFR